MLRSRHLIAPALLASLAVAFPTYSPADEPPVRPAAKAPDYPPGATDAEKRELDLWRVHQITDPAAKKKLAEAFPFVSLDDRLKFDAPGRARANKAFPTPALGLAGWSPFPAAPDPEKETPAGTATLQFENHLRRETRLVRARALAELHQVKVDEFVTSPGFGHERLVWMPSRTPDVPPKDWSEADRGDPVTLPAKGTFFNAQKDKAEPTLPAVDALSHFHAATAHEFVLADSLGLVKKDKSAAGFLPHALAGHAEPHFRTRRDPAAVLKDKDGRTTGHKVVERWAVRKVELIGLLMHDAPVVYLNPEGKLPSMDAVKDKGTREMTEFEATALKDLAAGKEVIAVDAVTNHVRMVGAIRMANSCLKCHEGKRGDLLGAFSYDLVRDPAFVRPEK